MNDIKRIKCPRCRGVFAVQAEAPDADIAAKHTPDDGAGSAEEGAKKPSFPTSANCPYCANTFAPAGV